MPGEFEIEYFGTPQNPKPCSGLDFVRPINTLEPNSLAPGSINTQSIDGMLSSSPWLANSPFSTTFAAGEWCMGIFLMVFPSSANIQVPHEYLVVTNVGVYTSNLLFPVASLATAVVPTLVLRHTWAPTEIDTNFMQPGNAVSFVQLAVAGVNYGVVFFSGLMLKGIFFWSMGTFTFGQASGYVCGAYLTELGGRLVLAECKFPTGGGPSGDVESSTVAWSGVGIFGQSWDLNPLHDVYDPANSAFFVGNIGGFNLLNDLRDQITGLCTVGRSAIILHETGITQQDPNSAYSTSGIQPFVWYHLWNSSQGVGAYKGTVAQYGEMIVFTSSDNVYALSLGGGLAAIGTKIIAKILAERRKIRVTTGVVESTTPVIGLILQSSWFFASLVIIAGQLHYFLTFSAYTTTPAVQPTAQNYFTFIYDYNLVEDAWHFVDFASYYRQTQQGTGFIGISCPILNAYITLAQKSVAAPPTSIVNVVYYPEFYMLPAFTSYGTLVAASGFLLSGQLFQLVPFDYDFATDWRTAFIAPLYPPLAVPQTTIVMRAETLAPGHKLSARRLRIQADNAPLPTVVANARQLANVAFLGSISRATAPTITMKGNAASDFLAMQTYYGDAVLSDEMIQPSMISPVVSVVNAWQSLAAFRISSLSMIGIDTKITTQ